MFKSLLKSRKFAAVALATGLAIGVSAGAEDRYALNGTPSTPTTPSTPAAPIATPLFRPIGPATTALTHETLVATLSNMGYEVEAKKNEAGIPYYSVKFDRNDWTFVINVSLSTNGQYIWLNSPLAQLPEGTNVVPQEKLTALLQKNFDTGPAYFAYRPASRRIYYLIPITNQNVTAKTLRAELDTFCKDIQDTELLWNTKKWNLAATPVAAPAVSSLR